jgi:catechol 2,3-dioxygenase-like lactoylglutathione lyase family enzyme
VIHVSEWPRSNAFYRDVLGADLVGDSDGVAMYRFGEQQLNVHGPGLNPEPVARLPVQPGGSDLCFTWPGAIEGAIDHLRARGVTVELGPVRRRGARGEGTSIYFRDPDGSLLELISYD